MILGRVGWNKRSNTMYDTDTLLYRFEVQFLAENGKPPITDLIVEDKTRKKTYELQAVNGNLACTNTDREGILRYGPQILGTPGLPPDKRSGIEKILNDLKLSKFRDIEERAKEAER